MKMKMKAAICGVLAAAMMAVAGCGGGNTAKPASSAQAGQSQLMQTIKNRGELIVGTASGYPPYEFVDTSKSDKTIVGIDMELAQKVADKLGVKLKVEDMNFSSLLSSLATGKVDIAIAGINPTDERKKSMDFSDGYLPTKQVIMIRKEDAGTLKTLEDFKGKTVGAEKATTQEKLAQTAMPFATLVSLTKVPDVVMELKSHKVDGLIVEGIVAEQYLMFNPDIVLSDATFKEGVKNSAVALPKGNEDLVKMINEVIKENTDNGNFSKWVEEYSKKAVENAKK
jgi:polar amino acid transport system substrate-binding protein